MPTRALTRAYGAARRLAVIVAVGIAAAATLTGCGGEEGGQAQPAPATVTVTETVEASPSPSGEESEDSSPGTDVAPSESAEPASSGESLGPWQAPSTPGVSIVASGYQVENSFGWGADYGLVLYNNGPSTSLDVVAQGIHNDQVVSTDEESLTHVPADSFFVIGSRIIDLKGKGDTLEFVVNDDGSQGGLIDVDLSVAASVPKGRGYQNIPVQITNAGADTMQKDSTIYVVLADADGNIVGGSDNFTSVAVPGGQTVRDVVADVEMPPGTSQVFAYVDLLNADRMFN